ncbi:MAG: phage portal protein, partial [Burkholderiales bacterium]
METPSKHHANVVTAAKPAIRPRALDRLIGYFSPAAGARRAQYRNFIGRMYEGANISVARQLRWGSPQDAGKELPQHDRITMVDRARYVTVNLGVARGALHDLRRYSLGPQGLVPESKSADEAWAKQAEDYFREWCKIADATGRFTFGELQRMAVYLAAVDGDCGFILTRTDSGFPKLQLIEGHRIADDGKRKDAVDGVLFDADGNAPIGYRVMTKNNANADAKVAATVEAANFIHFYDPDRYTAARGVTWL